MSKVNNNIDSKKPSKKSTKVRTKSEVTKCERCNKPFSYNPDGEKPALCKECRDADNKIVHRGVCKDCGKEFFVKAKDAAFLKSKGLELPKRCYECRKARKIEKAKGAK